MTDCQSPQISALGTGLKHILRPHPRIKLFIRQIPQLQRRLTQGQPFCVSLFGDFRRFVITNVRIQRRHQHERPIHQLAIVALGLPLVDVMDLEAAAETAARLKRWEFLVTAAAVPVLGGTGFPLNPIATF